MLQPVPFSELCWNVFEWIGERWMLVVGGTRESYNMMTASWGGVGVVWNEPMVFVFVRPSRYTHEFLMKYPSFSLVFLPEAFREILEVCGSRSGREIEKMKLGGITPLSLEGGAVGFEEAELILTCTTVCRQPIEPLSLLREDIRRAFYAGGDYHDLFIARIEEIWRPA
ncbi:MAG: flavin reductase [Brevinematales bacterium]|nr:flavin reductase [Brevinematales bacterium]